MSVLVSKRQESRLEVIANAVEIHDQLTDLMQRHFGIKEIKQTLRKKFEYGITPEDSFERSMYLIQDFKISIDQKAMSLINNLKSANTLYPTTIHEYEKRRDYQNIAIIECSCIINELQRIVDIFDVDINLYRKHISLIYREIGLIKKWRQHDNKIKTYLSDTV